VRVIVAGRTQMQTAVRFRVTETTGSNRVNRGGRNRGNLWDVLLPFASDFHTLRRAGAFHLRSPEFRRLKMNSTIYATILTGFGIVITLVVTMHNLAKMNQQETNRRIDELKQEIKRWIDEGKQETNRRIDDTNRRIDEFRQDTLRQFADLRQDLLGAVDSKSKVNDAQFEVVSVRFQKLEGNVAEIRQEVQVIKKELLKNAA
jgi:hypothetical protein